MDRDDHVFLLSSRVHNLQTRQVAILTASVFIQQYHFDRETNGIPSIPGKIGQIQIFMIVPPPLPSSITTRNLKPHTCPLDLIASFYPPPPCMEITLLFLHGIDGVFWWLIGE